MRLGRIAKNFRLLTLAALGLVLGAGTALSAPSSSDMVTVLKSTGLSCGGCASRITNALETVPGVASVKVDIESGRVTVWHDETAAPQKLAATVSEAGYQSIVQETMSADDYRTKAGKSGPGAARSGGCGGCGGGCCDRTKIR